MGLNLSKILQPWLGVIQEAKVASAGKMFFGFDTTQPQLTMGSPSVQLTSQQSFTPPTKDVIPVFTIMGIFEGNYTTPTIAQRLGGTAAYGTSSGDLDFIWTQSNSPERFTIVNARLPLIVGARESGPAPISVTLTATGLGASDTIDVVSLLVGFSFDEVTMFNF